MHARENGGQFKHMAGKEKEVNPVIKQNVHSYKEKEFQNINVTKYFCS